MTTIMAKGLTRAPRWQAHGGALPEGGQATAFRFTAMREAGGRGWVPGAFANILQTDRAAQGNMSHHRMDTNIHAQRTQKGAKGHVSLSIYHLNRSIRSRRRLLKVAKGWVGSRASREGFQAGCLSQRRRGILWR